MKNQILNCCPLAERSSQNIPRQKFASNFFFVENCMKTFLRNMSVIYHFKKGCQAICVSLTDGNGISDSVGDASNLSRFFASLWPPQFVMGLPTFYVLHVYTFRFILMNDHLLKSLSSLCKKTILKWLT